MEITVYPRSFGLVPHVVPQPDGSAAPATKLVIQDAGGTAISVVFSQEDFDRFKAYIADPEGETAKAAARAKIQIPGPTRASSIKSGKLH